MPRANPGRSIASEANLAKRIAYERACRGMSYEGLASLMTARGCSIQGSAIYKIEKGDPPRRVTVDELVALSEVFDIPIDGIDGLLRPMELIEKERAQVLIDELGEVVALLTETTVRLFEMGSEYLRLCQGNLELAEYVHHHWHVEKTEEADGLSGADESDDELTTDQHKAVAQAIEAKNVFVDEILRLAGEYFDSETAE